MEGYRELNFIKFNDKLRQREKVKFVRDSRLEGRRRGSRESQSMAQFPGRNCG